jgi:uncharacterized protein YuzE
MIVELAGHGSAYIRYRVGDAIVSPQEEVVAEVLVDRNTAGDVVGVEILDVGVDANVADARRFAADAGLPFPRDIAAALRAAAVA